MENNKKNSLEETSFWQRLCGLLPSLYFSKKQIKKENSIVITEEANEEEESLNIESDDNELNKAIEKFGHEKFNRIEQISLLKVSIERLLVGNSLDISNDFIHLLNKFLKKGKAGKDIIVSAFEGKINEVKSINISSFVKEIPNPNIFNIFKNVENFSYDGGCIKNFDLRAFEQLKKINLINKGLEMIKVQGCNNLEYVYLRGNKFTELNFTRCNNLKKVDVSNNPNLVIENIIGLPKNCKVIGLKEKETFLERLSKRIKQVSF